jgi:hypothetical protein
VQSDFSRKSLPPGWDVVAGYPASQIVSWYLLVNACCVVSFPWCFKRPLGPAFTFLGRCALWPAPGWIDVVSQMGAYGYKLGYVFVALEQGIVLASLVCQAMGCFVLVFGCSLPAA